MSKEKIPKLTHSEQIEFMKKSSYYHFDQSIIEPPSMTDGELEKAQQRRGKRPLIGKELREEFELWKANGWEEILAAEYKEMANRAYKEWLEEIKREKRGLDEVETEIQKSFLNDLEFYEQIEKQKPDLRILIRKGREYPAKVFWFGEKEEV